MYRISGAILDVNTLNQKEKSIVKSVYMRRRTFFTTAAGMGLAGSLTAASKQKAVIELTYILMRNSRSQQSRRTGDFISKSVVPSMKRAGSGPVGVFSNSIGPNAPYLLVVASYPSLAAYESLLAKIPQDQEYRDAAAAFYSAEEAGFQRVEKSLLRGFDAVPDIEVPPTEEGRPPRTFELRNYESKDFATLARKVDMFNKGEIAGFKRAGLTMVFFGETIVGPKMPDLTYMVTADDTAAREKAWSTFGADPEWKKLRSMPQYSDPGLVSNLSVSILQPAAGSDIR